MPDRTELAKNALREITGANTIGPLISETDEGGGVITMRFEAKMAGYPGWHWNVNVATVEGEAPTVLEAELQPGDGALLAPEWVPWADRMDEWRAAQESTSSDDDSDEDSDDDDDDDDEDEDDDFDDDDVNDDDEALLHSGDLDGVDIDSFVDSDDDIDAVDLEAEEIRAGETRIFAVDEDDESDDEDDDEDDESDGGSSDDDIR